MVLKALLAPLLILLATLAGRRWGPGVGGWLAGLPLTSGPVSLILALEQGPEFAARAALGTLFGLVALAAFALAYGVAAPRTGWPGCLVVAFGAFALTTLALRGATLPLGLAFMGPAWSEARLIELAYAYEQASKARKPPMFRPTVTLGKP